MDNSVKEPLRVMLVSPPLTKWEKVLSLVTLVGYIFVIAKEVKPK